MLEHKRPGIWLPHPMHPMQSDSLKKSHLSLHTRVGDSLPYHIPEVAQSWAREIPVVFLSLSTCTRKDKCSMPEVVCNWARLLFVLINIDWTSIRPELCLVHLAIANSWPAGAGTLPELAPSSVLFGSYH